MQCNLRTSELFWGYVFQINSNQHTVITLHWEPSVITVGRMRAQVTVTKIACMSDSFTFAALSENVLGQF